MIRNGPFLKKKLKLLPFTFMSQTSAKSAAFSMEKIASTYLLAFEFDM